MFYPLASSFKGSRATMYFIIFLAIFALPISAQHDQTMKRSYVCPPDFIRLSHRCYYFSDEATTWQNAYFKCRDRHSNLAIIKNANQDKLIRRTLNKKTLEPLERWLGGLYDWEQMSWKWAASGKTLVYQGFSRMDQENKDNLRWHCIIVDPNLQFKWSSRSCVKEKHYICHTKLKIVNNKDKKKLQRQYKVSKYKKLNEIPVPILPEDRYNLNNSTRLKENGLNAVTLDRFSATAAQFAKRPVTKINKRRKNRLHLKKNKFFEDKLINNGTFNENWHIKHGDIMGRRRRNKNGKMKRNKMQNIKWKTYFKDITLSPLHPKAIVEEFHYDKEMN